MRISFLICPKQTINYKYNHAAQKLQVQTNIQKSLTVPGSDTHIPEATNKCTEISNRSR